MNISLIADYLIIFSNVLLIVIFPIGWYLFQKFARRKEIDPDRSATIVGAEPGQYVAEKYRGPNYDGPLTPPKT